MTIKYIFWNDDTGYGTSAKQIIKALQQTGTNVLPMGLEHSSKSSSEYQIPKSFINSDPYDIVFIHSAPYYINRLLEPNKFNVAYCTWETSVLPRSWVDTLNKCDAIFVPSQFNKICFESSGVTRPIRLLPHISEFSGIANGDYSNSDRKEKAYTFYSIGMWTNRKNNLALIHAFRKAFEKNSNVRLVIKTSNKDYTIPASKIMRKLGFSYYNFVKTNRDLRILLKNDPRITLYFDHWNADQIADLHEQSDCYISLCKSEGWGMGAYEAAWFGNPIVITGYGGQLDFLPNDIAVLLPYKLEAIKEKVWTEYNTEGQKWAEADIQTAIEMMQRIVEHQDNFKIKGQLLKAHVKAHFNEKQIIGTFKQNLEQVRSIK
jgi:glycosyltransferase involved in cell wall biosynthesis